MTVTEWTAALDALEEWVRRTAAALAGTDPEVPPAPPALPAAAVPDDQRLRAQVIVTAMREAESNLLRRREQLRREQAYGAV